MPRIIHNHQIGARTEHRSIGLLIDAQVADAPRTVPLAVPYMHLQIAIESSGWTVCEIGRMPQNLRPQTVLLPK